MERWQGLGWEEAAGGGRMGEVEPRGSSRRAGSGTGIPGGGGVLGSVLLLLILEEKKYSPVDNIFFQGHP